MVQKRLFIGGLFPGVNEDELRQRFSSYGSVSDIEIKTKKDESGMYRHNDVRSTCIAPNRVTILKVIFQYLPNHRVTLVSCCAA